MVSANGSSLSSESRLRGTANSQASACSNQSGLTSAGDDGKRDTHITPFQVACDNLKTLTSQAINSKAGNAWHPNSEFQRHLVKAVTLIESHEAQPLTISMNTDLLLELYAGISSMELEEDFAICGQTLMDLVRHFSKIRSQLDGSSSPSDATLLWPRKLLMTSGCRASQCYGVDPETECTVDMSAIQAMWTYAKSMVKLADGLMDKSVSQATWQIANKANVVTLALIARLLCVTFGIRGKASQHPLSHPGPAVRETAKMAARELALLIMEARLFSDTFKSVHLSWDKCHPTRVDQFDYPFPFAASPNRCSMFDLNLNCSLVPALPAGTSWSPFGKSSTTATDDVFVKSLTSCAVEAEKKSADIWVCADFALKEWLSR